jgi:hypothetical protein
VHIVTQCAVTRIAYERLLRSPDSNR